MGPEASRRGEPARPQEALGERRAARLTLRRIRTVGDDDGCPAAARPLRPAREDSPFTTVALARTPAARLCPDGP
ncbi:hypothetical protein FRACA_1120006 [Frankia canadensis]|uniref:Uncharacterized protein n=1 Tax=Frankia canadensis TaxID=1836972 RepID=A0A2I2KJE8_9ACTN|nr:hypothetical protein FRACA_1120006 [Frankia canadensis]SOU53078.1 hypothetical protein FRACA_1120006 [Frankia canadensis]